MILIDYIKTAMSRLAHQTGDIEKFHITLKHSLRHQTLDHRALARLTAEAAYHRAGQRGFAVGYELRDWLEAEKEILARFHAA